MKIRQFKEKDKPELQKLLCEFLSYTKKNYSKQTRHYRRTIKDKEDAYVDHYIKSFLSFKHSRFLVAEDGGKLVGYILGYIEKNIYEKDTYRGHIESFYVLEEYRKKKFGKQLYDALVGWFKKKECSQLILHVAEGNPSMHIYRKWGFETVSKEMRKKI